ncbi:MULTISPECIES: ABC transporter substrate-binding protein [unclassified Paenibacillus]|uniref:ABC transporter substrate-binding protein n=1 Tax=unclassified Paenibacillus TaxID=185978 RepID=UPI00362B2E63
MKTFKKASLKALVVSQMLALVLAGCSSSAPANSTKPDTAPKADESKKQVKLTWLVRSEPSVEPWYSAMVKGFEAKNPNIKIELQVIPQAEVDQRLTTMIAGKNVPDVWSPNWANSGYPTYKNMDALLDLTSYIKKDRELYKGIPDEVLNIYSKDGKYYGFPMSNTSTFLFYNKDLFDAAGLPYPSLDWNDKSWNWNAMVETAKKLTKDIGDPSKQVFGVWNAQPANKSAWLFGGDFFKKEAYDTGNMGDPQVSKNPKNIEAIQANLDLISKHKVSPNPAQLSAASQLGDPFMTGRVAMVIQGGWGFRTYRDAKFKWAAAAVPFAPDGSKQIPLYVDPWSISKTSKNPNEAWEFIKFLTDPTNGAKEYVKAAMSYPANLDLAQDWYQATTSVSAMSMQDIKKVYEGSIPFGRPSDNHKISKFSTILTTSNQTFDAIYNGKVSVEEGLKTIDQNLSSLK